MTFGGGWALTGLAGLLLVASLLYRLATRKPIWFFSVPGAEFHEQGASGGQARGCLVVAIKAGRLIIRPFFPFNLLFLPEVHHLELDVALEQVVWVDVTPGKPSFWTRHHPNVRLRIREPGRDAVTVEVALSNPEAFQKLMPIRA